jgi:hypothetical protein
VHHEPNGADDDHHEDNEYHGTDADDDKMFDDADNDDQITMVPLMMCVITMMLPIDGIMMRMMIPMMTSTLMMTLAFSF